MNQALIIKRDGLEAGQEKRKGVKRKKTKSDKECLAIVLYDFVLLVRKLSEELALNPSIDLTQLVAARLEDLNSIKTLDPSDAQFTEYDVKSVIDAVLQGAFARKIQIHFPREMFSVFLASYSGHLMPVDFVGTNHVAQVGDAKLKSAFSATLMEYSSPKLSMPGFVTLAAKQDPDLVKAMKFIVTHRMRLPKAMYSIPCKLSLTFRPPTWEREEEVVDRHSTHFKLPINSTCKPQYILLTRDVMMLYDGCQFVAPQMSLENQIPLSAKLHLKDGEYVVLECLNQSKLRIIDLVASNVLDLPPGYKDRLDSIRDIFSKDLPLDAGTKSDVSDCGNNYILKPNEGFGRCYIVNRNFTTAAVVGLVGNEAVLAFRLNKDVLQVKDKKPITGPSLQTLFLLPTTAPNMQGVLTIVCEGKEMLVDLSKCKFPADDLQCFSEAVALELKEVSASTKVGSLSSRPISPPSAYKGSHSSKEDNQMKHDEVVAKGDDLDFALRLIKYRTSPEKLIETHQGIQNSELFTEYQKKHLTKVYSPPEVVTPFV